MADTYDFNAVERKWQAYWDAQHCFTAEADHSKPKFYALVEFPYPSGAGMHVGHIKAYTSLEILSRKRRMQGYNVLFPMGFDSFGLPAENYAIKTNTHPHVITTANIEHFKDQMKRVGYSFDWTREIATSVPEYYKWTQWIFRKLFDHGLVFRAKTLVNYCPNCKVVLSNEDSQGGKCDVCHSDVVQLSKDVWYLKITAYADKLLDGLNDVDYPDSIKQQEIDWIGKSVGAFVNFKIKDVPEALEIYTTRCDTLFGVTFMVVAPEHPMLDKYRARIENWDEVEAYRAACAKKTEFERTQLSKEKTGVRLKGFTAINPVSGKEIPVFIADYVMMGYGTGAIMAVPAHDQRDWEFAKKFGVEILPVIEGGDVEKRGVRRRRQNDQFRLPERLRQQKGFHRRDARVPRRTRSRQKGHSVQDEGLGVQPPALLGRADPADPLSEVRHGRRPVRRTAADASRRGKLRARHRRTEPACADRIVRQLHLPEVRRACQA